MQTDQSGEPAPRRAEAIELNSDGELCYAERGPAPEQAAADAVELDETRRRVDESRIDMMRASWGPGTVMRIEPDRITVLFETNGYKTLSLNAVQRDNLLTLATQKAG